MKHALLRLVVFSGAIAWLSVAALAEEITAIKVHVNDGAGRPYTKIGVEMSPPINEIMAAMQDPASMQRMMADLGSTANEGKAVTMHLPAIDYGATGTYSGVRVSAGTGVSFDPGYFEATGREKYTGTVAILEFTEEQLTGEYNAELYEPYYVEGRARPLARHVQSVSGWFSKGMPVLDDPRREYELPPTELARAEAVALWDGLRLAGMTVDDMGRFDEMRSLATELERQLRSDKTAPSRGGIDQKSDGPCNCTCEYLNALPADSPCRTRCKTKGVTCETPVPDADSNAQAIIDELVALGYPLEAATMIAKGMADVSPEERQMMLELYRRSAPDPGN